jgi:hypothetical protein
MVDAEILAYYACGLERDRLASGRQRIEFPRIWDLLERCLPAAPATVVDVGGGAGIYAIPLASAGYEVHLVDPVPLHVEQAAAAARQAGRQAGRHATGQHLGRRRARSADSRRQRTPSCCSARFTTSPAGTTA